MDLEKPKQLAHRLKRNKFAEEAYCVTCFLRNEGHDVKGWNIANNGNDSDGVDILARHEQGNDIFHFQVTAFDPEKIGDLGKQGWTVRARNTDLLRSMICNIICKKFDKYRRGNLNISNIILLLDYYKDIPFGFDKDLENWSGCEKSTDFEAIYIVCASYNIKIGNKLTLTGNFS